LRNVYNIIKHSATAVGQMFVVGADISRINNLKLRTYTYVAK